MSSYIEKIKALGNSNVTIGIQGEKGEQKKIVRLHPFDYKLKPGEQREKVDDGLTVAYVANSLHKGLGTTWWGAPIPARPFLTYTLDEKKKEIMDLAAKAISKPESFYDILGLFIVGLVKKTILSKPFDPNSPITIKFKGSSTPLIDTGQLINSLTYKVNKND